MGKLEKLGLVLWILGLVSIAVNVICNSFVGTTFDVNYHNLLIFIVGMILFVAGKSPKTK